jgi:hypothetical protein
LSTILKLGLSGFGRIGTAVLWASLLLASTPAWARYEPPPPCKNAFTHDQEVTAGAKVAAEVYKEMPVLPESDPVSRYVAQLGNRLVEHAPGGPNAWPYSFHVVASEDINAFALPGGAMFVNLGAVQAAESEAQLAGVMAHELSHVILRHATCNITKQQKKSLWYGLGQIASQVMLGGTAGDLAAGAINMGAGLDFLHMSRGDETQADLLGTQILYDSGFDPRGLAQFFEIIQAKYGSGGAQFLSDHPNPGNRTRAVQDEIATFPRRTDQVVTSPEFVRIHKIAMGEKVFTAEQIKAGVWKHGGYIAGPGGSTPADTTAGNSTDKAQQASARRLSKTELGLDTGLATYHGPGFAMDIPGNWKGNTASDGTVTIAPAGGAGEFGISYGALVGTLKAGDAPLSADSLQTVTRQLVQQFKAKQNMQQNGDVASIQVGQQQANSVDLRGQSPVQDGGMGLAEHDWLVTIARPDGGISYIVFVAPERDFATLRPTFQAMLESFRPAELPNMQ